MTGVRASSERGAIGFAEKLLQLLDEGQFTATYKYAVLLGLLDLCLENVSAKGVAPSVLTTRQLAEKTIALYWPHTLPYTGKTGVLRQNAGSACTQAEILRAIARFRDDVADDPFAPLERAKRQAAKRFERLTRTVEWKLIEMPLPRVQVVGVTEDRFIYDIAWDKNIRRSTVAAYQDGKPGQFDNRIALKPNVGDYLVELNALLRPLVHRQWARMVARLNKLTEARLETFLFGAQRVPTNALRPGLIELQDGMCFYCRRALKREVDVDHFIPWSRYPEDGVANLVAAHRTCNSAKRDFLAATEHVERWRYRADDAAILRLADDASWRNGRDDALSVARAIYLRLPVGTKLWLAGRKLLNAEPDGLREVLS